MYLTIYDIWYQGNVRLSTREERKYKSLNLLTLALEEFFSFFFLVLLLVTYFIKFNTSVVKYDYIKSQLIW